MARLYSNENFPLPVVQSLRALGHDVQTIRDAGKDGLAVPDNEVLEHAAKEGRILLTLNRQDFKKLHRQNPEHSGIILCTVDADFPGQASRIHIALLANPSLEGQLLRVNRLQTP